MLMIACLSTALVFSGQFGVNDSDIYTDSETNLNTTLFTSTITLSLQLSDLKSTTANNKTYVVSVKKLLGDFSQAALHQDTHNLSRVMKLDMELLSHKVMLDLNLRMAHCMSVKDASSCAVALSQGLMAISAVIAAVHNVSKHRATIAFEEISSRIETFVMRKVRADPNVIPQILNTTKISLNSTFQNVLRDLTNVTNAMMNHAFKKLTIVVVQHDISILQKMSYVADELCSNQFTFSWLTFNPESFWRPHFFVRFCSQCFLN